MKAIFVIEEMPKTCDECPIDGKACLLWAWVDDIKINKSEHCPLRPLPKKHTELDAFSEGDDYVDGWNDCIDAITGETESY